MKVYITLKLSKGYKHWKTGFDNLGPEMRAVGMNIIFAGCEANDQNNVHMILGMPSIETVQKFLKNSEIQKKLDESGVKFASLSVIPLAD